MEAFAGTSEKMDAEVTVFDEIDGMQSEKIQIEITSPVKSLFGPAQKTAVLNALIELGVQQCRVKIADNQAVDAVLAARVKAAVLRLRQAGGAV